MITTRNVSILTLLLVTAVLLYGCRGRYDADYYKCVKPVYKDGKIVWHGTEKCPHSDTWCYYCNLDKEYKAGKYGTGNR